MAKQYYNDALAVYETEKYPADQLVLIDTKIQEQEQEKLANEQKNQQFDALLLEGDQLLVEKKFKEARGKYQEARSLFPDRSVVDQKLQHLNGIHQFMAKQKQDSSYNA